MDGQCVCLCVCACVRACVRARVRVRACVRACVRVRAFVRAPTSTTHMRVNPPFSPPSLSHQPPHTSGDELNYMENSEDMDLEDDDLIEVD